VSNSAGFASSFDIPRSITFSSFAYLREFFTLASFASFTRLPKSDSNFDESFQLRKSEVLVSFIGLNEFVALIESASLCCSVAFVSSLKWVESVQMTASGTFSPLPGPNTTATFSPSDQLTAFDLLAASDELCQSAGFSSRTGGVISDVFRELANGRASFDFCDSDSIVLSPKLEESLARFIDHSPQIGSTTALVCSANSISMLAAQVTSATSWNRPSVIDSSVLVQSNSLTGSSVVEWTGPDGVGTMIQSDATSTRTATMAGVGSLKTVGPRLLLVIGLASGVLAVLIVTIVAWILIRSRRSRVTTASDLASLDHSPPPEVQLENVPSDPASAFHSFTGFSGETRAGPNYTDYVTCFEQDHDEIFCSVTLPTGFIA
jgi:hypothetical protein